MKKNGFTLVEIIVVVVLLSIITTISIVNINSVTKNKNIKSQNKIFSNFDNALDVYLSNHPEIYKNLKDNAEGAIITLELLKNEGLISDNIQDPTTKQNIDYSNNYYVLADAVLLSDEEAEESNKNCSGQIAITVIKNWEVLNGTIAENDVVYICPKNETKVENKGNSGVDELEKRISALEKLSGNEKRIFSGESANNYVYFNVETTHTNADMAYWPSDNKNLWRIYSYYGVDGTTNNIKLVYSQPVTINDKYIQVTKKSRTGYTYYLNNTDTVVPATNVYQIENCTIKDGSSNRTIFQIDNEYYMYMGCRGKCKRDKSYVTKITKTIDKYLPNSFNCTGTPIKYTRGHFSVSLDSNNKYPEQSIKNHLLQKIKYKDWVEAYPYYTYYNGTNRIDAKLDYSYVKYDKLGVITLNEFVDTITAAKSWLKYYDTNFIGELSYSFDNYMVYPEMSSKISTKDSSDATASLIPVVTLKSGIKIESDDTCGTPGTISCPYRLSYNGITTTN